MLARLAQRIASYLPDTVSGTDAECLQYLLKDKDYYGLDQFSTRRPFDRSKIKVLRKASRPLDLASRLSGEAREYHTNYTSLIERTEDEMEAMLASGDMPDIRPDWDPELGNNRGTRISFLQDLVRAGLGGFRLSIRGKFGIFFVT